MNENGLVVRDVRRRPLVPANNLAFPRDDAGENLRAAEFEADRAAALLTTVS